MDAARSRARLDHMATGAGDRRGFIFWVDSLFHSTPLSPGFIAQGVSGFNRPPRLIDEREDQTGHKPKYLF